MGNLIVRQTIQMLARMILGSGAFDHVLAVVTEWADKKISGAEKRQGVLDQLQVIGLNTGKSTANLAIELAVQYLNRKAR